MVVFDNKEEVNHVVQVLREAQSALNNDNAFKLQQLSDQTIHSASIHQHTDFITIAVIMYSLNKLVVKKQKMHLPKWPVFVKKFNEEIDQAINSLKQKDNEEFLRHIEHTKGLLETLSPSIKENVQEVIRRASINKAGRIYEHGISLSQTAKLLGVSEWELAEYIGQRITHEPAFTSTIDVKKRAKVALDFFS